jgi:hypothetical protein
LLHKDRFYEGELKNYSDCGLFIQTEALLYAGDVITIALPYEQGKNTKIKGQIVRCDRKGYGIELFQKRSAENDKILNKL